MDKKNSSNSFLWRLPHINVKEEFLHSQNPYINIETNFTPFQCTTEKMKIEFLEFNTILESTHLPKTNDIAVVSHAMDYPSSLHSHDYIELIYIPKGQVLNIINHKPYIMEEGDLCLMEVGTVHLITPIVSEKEQAFVVNIMIHPRLFDKLTPFFSEKQTLNLLFSNLEENHTIIQKDKLFSLGHFLYQFIISYYQSNFKTNYAVLGNFLVFIDKFALLNSQNGLLYDDLTKAVLRLIQENCATISLEKISKKTNYSKGYLSRHLKKQTTKTISQLITEEKLILAGKYLAESNFTISEIAELIGYQSESHFYRLFKERFHLTPKDYRKLFLNY